MFKKYLLNRLEEVVTWEAILFLVNMYLLHYGLAYSWTIAVAEAATVAKVFQAIVPQEAEIVSEIKKYWGIVWNYLKELKTRLSTRS